MPTHRGRELAKETIVEEPFWGTSWFSQQTDDYFVQLTPFYSLVQCLKTKVVVNLQKVLRLFISKMIGYNFSIN